jgi:hypothetical protein
MRFCLFHMAYLFILQFTQLLYIFKRYTTYYIRYIHTYTCVLEVI